MRSLLEPFFSRSSSSIIPGAHRLQKLLIKWLDHGILNIPSVLITGSNGKGTTCAFIESIFRAHGFKTGLYTSPHLIHPNERIRLNGIPVREKILEKSVSQILEQANEHLPDASFFEILTASAMLIFQEENIDFLICEVGLGGYFDSTNAISPQVSAITTVALEHGQLLGDSLYKIAKDKAFVSRRNRPLIVGSGIANEALEGILSTTDVIGSHIISANQNLIHKYNQLFFKESIPKNSSSFVSLNKDNLETALTVIDNLKDVIQIDPQKLNEAISNTFWPGRFDVRQINNRSVIFDASHNPEGFNFFLKQYIMSEFSNKKCVLLFASLSDKDWRSMLLKIPQIADSVFFTQIDSDRAENAENFSNYAHMLANHFVPYEKIPNLDQAIKKSLSFKPELPLVITGSIAFIGTVMQCTKVEAFPHG